MFPGSHLERAQVRPVILEVKRFRAPSKAVLFLSYNPMSIMVQEAEECWSTLLFGHAR
jgi:hypothetical protein